MIDLNDSIHPHHLKIEENLSLLGSHLQGLQTEEAQKRLKHFGLNVLPTSEPPGLLKVFFDQFLDPLIYVLLFTAGVSFFLGHLSDGGFILGVLFINSIIGTFQEYSAEKSAEALQKLTKTLVIVSRSGENFEISSEKLVPGDIVYLDSGSKVPADLRLLSTSSLLIDESLLTGESLPVEKHDDRIVDVDTPVADRINMSFAGTMVTKGRGVGLVVATANYTEVGKLASGISSDQDAKTPLIIRMEKFTRTLVYLMGGVIIFLSVILLATGQDYISVLLFAVALAVAAIPEGLPVALTIALSIASRRMASKNVIVRKLAAVEALGSCSYIATDKTGTLTVNELTVEKVQLPGQRAWSITGEGMNPQGEVLFETEDERNFENIKKLSNSASLCNEASLALKNEQWVGHGDSVDIAFLVLAHKVGITKSCLESDYHLIDSIPYESEIKYAGSLHKNNENTYLISVKGALENVIQMCTHMQNIDGISPINSTNIHMQAQELAQAGYRVLAVASKNDNEIKDTALKASHLQGMTFLGLVGMIDPLRADAKDAIDKAKKAGVSVGMVTGDHPLTAFAIAKKLDLVNELAEVVTGIDLKEASNEKDFDDLVSRAKVFARVEPNQKLQIVQSLQRAGHFVAVTGDGANDAPALKAANVGVSMGVRGTDVARETSDLILADDHFSSIIEGIFEGRIAYSNVRKVVYLLISTGMAEIILFVFSILWNLPIPLTAVQLLWLNLVTEGLQGVAIAFEKEEGDELNKPPRRPQEPIFDKILLQRVILSAMVMGTVSFGYYWFLLKQGSEHFEAQNLVLLLMVLFENIIIGNARSESRSLLFVSPFNNIFLMFSALAAQGLHIWAMHSDFLGKILGVSPVSLNQWLQCLLLAGSALVVVEIHKLFLAKRKLA